MTQTQLRAMLTHFRTGIGEFRSSVLTACRRIALRDGRTPYGFVMFSELNVAGESVGRRRAGDGMRRRIDGESRGGSGRQECSTPRERRLSGRRSGTLRSASFLAMNFSSFGKVNERSPQSLQRMCSLPHRSRIKGVRAIRRTQVEPHSGQGAMGNTDEL